MRKCIKCGAELIENVTWYAWSKRDRCYQCKECVKARQRTRQYRQNVNKRMKYASLRAAIIEKLGGKCVECGFTDIRALQIDHVNGGGRKEIQGFRNNLRNYYQSVLKKINAGSKEYQCLCANCNYIKFRERIIV